MFGEENAWGGGETHIAGRTVFVCGADGPGGSEEVPNLLVTPRCAGYSDEGWCALARGKGMRTRTRTSHS